MGDRICLNFIDETGEVSPTLYAHWDGKSLLRRAQEFHRKYQGKIRTEASNYMFNFVAYISEGHVEDGNYYLYPTQDLACSPDDNGYFTMDTVTGDFL